MEVNNYPMRARTLDEVNELEDVISQRTMEIEDLKVKTCNTIWFTDFF